MLKVNGAYDSHVASRLLDFFNSNTPWQRRLWNSGIVLTLREAQESSQAVAAGVLSNATLHNVLSTATILAARDPGVGDYSQLKVLQNALRSDSKNGGLDRDGHDYRLMQLLLGDIEANYLDRWAKALSVTGAVPGPERTARAIASHMLDEGFSSDFLHQWWTLRIYGRDNSPTLSEIVADAHVLVSSPPREFELAIGFEHAPPPYLVPPPKDSLWVSNTDLSIWLRANGFDVAGVRTRGGLKFKLKARDAKTAADIAAETVDRIVSRADLGTYRKVVPINSVWIAGEKRAVPLKARRRRVEIHAVSRENRLYSVSEISIVDAAIELAAPLDMESPSPAVAGGWAAIEALLTGPGDKERVLAGDRMAALVACSFPRAEFTDLSYKLEKQGGDLADKLKECTSNRNRAGLLVDSIVAGTPPKFQRPSDVAALERMSALLKSPSRTLEDIEHHVSTAFRRLYRHRNMVLHWGKTDSVGLRACLRTTAPLVGAGLDRIAHAWLVGGTHPLELAARARLRLGTIGASPAPSVLDLLE
jgi:hypothetical protein